MAAWAVGWSLSVWALTAIGAAQEVSLGGPAQVRGDGSLEQQVSAILTEPAVARAHWGISVRTLDGAVLLARNDGQLFQPASTAKLFTTAAGMALLGGDATVTTRVLAGGVVDSAGELKGDLVLAGAGDANVSGRVLPYAAPSQGRTGSSGQASAPDPDPLGPLAAMADAVAATGLKVVTGDVIGDDRLFAWEPYALGWELEDLVWGYGAPVSALSVADNQLRLTVTPGSRAGQPAAVVLAQAAPYYVVEATVMTSAAKSTVGGVQVERAPGGRALRVYGQIAADAGPDVEQVAIADPAEYAAMALRGMLEARGVQVRGGAVGLHRYPGSAKGFLAQVREPIKGLEHGARLAGGSGSSECDVPSGAGEPTRGGGDAQSCGAMKVLAQHASPPLELDVAVTNKTSQNLHAELLLHRLGLASGDAPPDGGSTAQGARVVRQFLLNAGLSKDDFVFYDGSGLSGHDLATPRAETELLRYASRQPWFAAWKASLPVGGVDGTLESRFTREALKGRVFAKTGTLGEARALAGYVTCASGRTVLFSIMDGQHLPGSSADRDAMDRIVAAIAATN